MPGVLFEKKIWMAAGHNTTYISYTLKEAPEGSQAHVHLVPLIAWKDYHSEMRATDPIPFQWYSPSSQVARGPGDPCGVLRIPLPPINRVTNQSFTLDLHVTEPDGETCADVKFLAQPYWFYNFQHPREQERGLDYDEDLFSMGMLSITLAVGESVTIVATVDAERPEPAALALEKLTAYQTERLQTLDTDDAFTQQLTLSAESFLVQVPGARSTIIAGYPWFAIGAGTP